MRKIIFLALGLLVFSILFPIQPRIAAQALPEGDETTSGAVVCEPGDYSLQTPTECLPLGPSLFISRIADLGLNIPPRPLPASSPDPTLSDLPYRYFKLDDDYVPIYGSPGETGPGVQGFSPGFVYITYKDRVESNGVYYLMENGGWIPGKGQRINELPKFQGLQFYATPRNSFGWTYDQIPIKLAPGYNAPDTGNWLNVYDIVQIYDTQNVDGADWNMIGINQWVEARKVAQVIINTTPPEGVNNQRWIDVNLAEQTLAVYDSQELIFATVIASGLEPLWTRPGLFQIFQKKEAETMRNSDLTDFYYLDNVPWTMYFDGARALHGAYWRTRFGYPQSHGCINLSVGDSHWLFNWAVEGDWVYVHDPSGLTPTDPALYPNFAY